jgi:hypothetical protein
MSVTLEVSRLSGWLNADAPCRVEGRGTCTCDAGRGARREAGGCGVAAAQAACSGKARDSRLLGGVRVRARAERTPNMLFMFVTLDVSQLEMSALKFFKL